MGVELAIPGTDELLDLGGIIRLQPSIAIAGINYKRHPFLFVVDLGQLGVRLANTKTIYIAIIFGQAESNLVYLRIYKDKELVKSQQSAQPFQTSYTPTTKTKPKDSTKGCGQYNGRSLNIGPRGGCYYINSNGNKTYVDRSYCKC